MREIEVFFSELEFSFSVMGCSEVVDSCTCTITVLTDTVFIFDQF